MVCGELVVAFSLGVPPVQALPICVIGNILPIPFILLFIKKIFAWLRPTKVLGALIAALLGIDIKKSSIAILCGVMMATTIVYVLSYVVVGNVVS